VYVFFRFSALLLWAAAHWERWVDCHRKTARTNVLHSLA